MHRTSSPTGNTKNILSADPRRNASLLPDREVRFFFFFKSGGINYFSEMGLFAELEFEICLCVCVLKNMVFVYCAVVSKNGFC